MSNVAIDLTKTVKEIITTMKTAIDNLNSDVATNKTAIDNLNSDVATNKTAIDNLKTQILEAVYPVGSVYVSITDSRNPANILGFGTWEALPAGYGLVAQGTATAEDGSTLTFTPGQKSGEFKHQITVGEMAEHSHTLYGSDSDNPLITHTNYSDAPDSRKWTKNYHNWVNSMTSAGGNQYHNNLSPAIAVYIWKRVS